MDREARTRKAYESLKGAVERLERQLAECRSRNATLEAEKRQWEIERIAQQAVIHKALLAANSTSQGYLEENRRLKEEIRRLGGG